MAGFAIVIVVAVGGLTWIAGRLFGFGRQLLVAVLITTMFANSGNFGLSLTLFAFGKEALTYAALYFVTTAILTYTLGVVIASLGSASLGQALLGLFKVPAVYAVVLALIFSQLDWQLPLFADRTVSLLGNAAVPVLLVLMGLQLQHSKFNGDLRALATSNTIRLVISPALAIGLSIVFGLQGAARQAGIIESAMPTAIMTTVLATEYNVKPSFVSTAVFTSTLLTPLTLTPLLAYLGA